MPALLAAALLLGGAAAYPSSIECGTDATSRLKAGAAIMSAVVTPVPAGQGPVAVRSTATTVTVTFETVYFALKAWGPAGTALICPAAAMPAGLNISATANCSSQVFLGSDAPAGGQSFTCTHNGATGFALAYSGTGRLISLVTEGVQPPPANSTPSSAPSSPTGMTAVVR